MIGRYVPHGAVASFFVIVGLLKTGGIGDTLSLRIEKKNGKS
jgi:hypothetical protein